MKRKGIPEEEQKKALDMLEELKLVDDEKFARSWVNSRDRLMPRGEPVLVQELRQKGIAKEIISQVLQKRKLDMQELKEVPDEFEQAMRIANSKERTYSNLDFATKQRRVTALLQRRGFSYGVIRRILDTYVNDSKNEPGRMD